jgi:hypothetical protein
MGLQLSIADSSHSSLLSKHIQRPIAANGIKPLRQMVADLSRLLAKELQESVLNDFSRPFPVASNVGRITRQRLFVFG